MNLTLNSETIYNASMVTAIQDSDNDQHGGYVDAKECIWKIVPPIIVSLGTFGNGLIIVVLLEQIGTLSSTGIYLLSLAFSDLMILYLGPVRQWIMYMWNVDIRVLSDAGCMTSLFFTYFSFHLSSWLLVAVTIERVISVVLPHKVKFACTTVKAGSIVLITVVCFAAFNAHFFYGFGLKKVSTNIKVNRLCAPLYKNYAAFVYDILPWLDFAIVFALPFIILLTGNILIIASLKRRTHNRRRLGATLTEKEGHSITTMLIMLCVVFFICLTPANIYFILLPYLRASALELPKSDMLRRRDFLIFMHAVVSCFNYINSTTNFMLYCLSGSRFRAEVLHLFTCRLAGKEDVFGSSSPRKSNKYVTLHSSKILKSTETVPYYGNGSMRFKTANEKNLHSIISGTNGKENNADRRCFVVHEPLDNHNVVETETRVSHL